MFWMAGIRKMLAEEHVEITLELALKAADRVLSRIADEVDY